MKVSVLGSGSQGNAILVRSEQTALLVDAGFSARDLERRLDAVGTDPGEIEGIVITHDHGDHTRGMGVFARRHGTPVYMTDATRRACARLFRGSEAVEDYRPGRPFGVGNVRVEPVMTIHDAADPVAVSVVDVDTGVRVGVATDLGRPTTLLRHALAGADFLILEANHDEGLLHQSARPVSVKARIASSHGHLSNRAAARLARELLHPYLAGIVLAHLSEECNTPELAETAVARELGQAGFRGYLEVARQHEPTPLVDVLELRERVGPDQLSLF